jgi:hypothetical protein
MNTYGKELKLAFFGLKCRLGINLYKAQWPWQNSGTGGFQTGTELSSYVVRRAPV